jgi:hypothetical protein
MKRLELLLLTSFSMISVTITPDPGHTLKTTDLTTMTPRQLMDTILDLTPDGFRMFFCLILRHLGGICNSAVHLFVSLHTCHHSTSLLSPAHLSPCDDFLLFLFLSLTILTRLILYCNLSNLTPLIFCDLINTIDDCRSPLQEGRGSRCCHQLLSLTHPALLERQKNPIRRLLQLPPERHSSHLRPNLYVMQIFLPKKCGLDRG